MPCHTATRGSSRISQEAERVMGKLGKSDAETVVSKGKDGQGGVSRLSIASLNSFSELLGIGVFLSCVVSGLGGDW